MRIAILGGSFNPLHIGHLFIAEEARTVLGYEKIIFVPSNISSHKDDFTGLKPEIRLEMVEAVISGNSFFTLDDCDIKRGGVSYTIDTIADLSKKFSFTGKPGFIIGDDLLDGFSKWKNSGMLREMIDLVVVKRYLHTKPETIKPDFYIDNTILPISSTDIRNRVKEGRSIKYLVPEIVREKILENGYYR